MDETLTQQPLETRPVYTRKRIQKELRGHAEMIDFLLAKWPDSPDTDELLLLKRDVASAQEAMRK